MSRHKGKTQGEKMLHIQITTAKIILIANTLVPSPVGGIAYA